MITSRVKISEHFDASEFRCQHCGAIKIDNELVNKLEQLFAKLHASKCIVSSGYRCSVFDRQIGGFLGRHFEGLASDVVYYDKNGNMIPSTIVCCVANDLGIFGGIARIDGYYVHLDNRKGSTYKGDEQRGNSSYWGDPYAYFGVSHHDVEVYTGTPVTSTTKWLNLPEDAETWRVYRINVQPVRGNECGFIKPKKFGGLSYIILGNPMLDVFTIKTDSFGVVNIYGAPSTGASVTFTRKYECGN